MQGSHGELRGRNVASFKIAIAVVDEEFKLPIAVLRVRVMTSRVGLPYNTRHAPHLRRLDGGEGCV